MIYSYRKVGKRQEKTTWPENDVDVLTEALICALPPCCLIDRLLPP